MEISTRSVNLSDPVDVMANSTGINPSKMEASISPVKMEMIDQAIDEFSKMTVDLESSDDESKSQIDMISLKLRRINP